MATTVSLIAAGVFAIQCAPIFFVRFFFLFSLTQVEEEKIK
jgi:hypothetical protein